MLMGGRLEQNPNVFIMGEEVAQYDGAYKVTKVGHSGIDIWHWLMGVVGTLGQVRREASCMLPHVCKWGCILMRCRLTLQLLSTVGMAWKSTAD